MFELSSKTQEVAVAGRNRTVRRSVFLRNKLFFPLSRAHKIKEWCRALLFVSLGILMGSLHSLGIWPRIASATYCQSVAWVSPYKYSRFPDSLKQLSDCLISFHAFISENIDYVLKKIDWVSKPLLAEHEDQRLAVTKVLHWTWSDSLPSTIHCRQGLPWNLY